MNNPFQTFGALLSTVTAFLSPPLENDDIEERNAPLPDPPLGGFVGCTTTAGCVGGGGGGGGGADTEGGGGGGGATTTFAV